MSFDETKAALDSLERVFLTHVENLWKFIGFLLLVLGWLITSESARLFLSNHFYVKAMFLITVALSVFAWIIVSIINYKKAESIGQFLSSRMDEAIYKGMQIKLSILIVNIFIVIFLGVMITTTLTAV